MPSLLFVCLFHFFLPALIDEYYPEEVPSLMLHQQATGVDYRSAHLLSDTFVGFKYSLKKKANLSKENSVAVCLFVIP